MSAHRRLWTAAEVRYLSKAYAMRPTAELAERFGRPPHQVHAKANKLGLRKAPEYFGQHEAGRFNGKRGAHHRFPPGHEPWNKGTHFVAGGRSAETRYKPGNISGRAAERLRPIGAYRINSDGYLDQKVSNDGRGSQRWKALHRLVWERANGPVPAGHAIVFKPGRRTTKLEDITLEVLELVTRRELMRRNTLHRYPKEIALAIQAKGALQRQINKRESRA